MLCYGTVHYRMIIISISIIVITISVLLLSKINVIIVIISIMIMIVIIIIGRRPPPRGHGLLPVGRGARPLEAPLMYKHN